MESPVQKVGKEEVRIGNDIGGFGRTGRVRARIGISLQGNDGDRQEVLKDIDIAHRNPLSVPVVETIDREEQVKIELVVAVIMLIPDPVEFLREVDLGILKGRGGIDGGGFESVEVDDAFGNSQDVLSNLFRERK